MKPSPLPSQETLRELLDYTQEGQLLWKHTDRQKKAGATAGNVHPDGYRKIRCNGRLYPAHRLVFQWHHGNCPEMLDHINRNRDDNRIENLREATAFQNHHNIQGWSKSGHKNISITPSGTYRVGVQANGCEHRKTFKTLEEAVPYANQLRNQLHGSFAFSGSGTTQGRTCDS